MRHCTGLMNDAAIYIHHYFRMLDMVMAPSGLAGPQANPAQEGWPGYSRRRSGNRGTCVSCRLLLMEISLIALSKSTSCKRPTPAPPCRLHLNLSTRLARVARMDRHTSGTYTGVKGFFNEILSFIYLSVTSFLIHSIMKSLLVLGGRG